MIIEAVELAGGESLIKVAVYIDGVLQGTVVADGKEVDFAFEGIDYEAGSTIEVYGFDAYLNSEKVKVQ